MQLEPRLRSSAEGLAAALRRDVDWEKLQDQAERALKTFESLHTRMAKVRAGVATVRPLTLPMAETAWEDATKIAAAEPRGSAARLRADLARIGDAVVIETTSPTFATQFRKERPKLEKQLERMDEVSAYLKSTIYELRIMKAQLRRSPG